MKLDTFMQQIQPPVEFNPSDKEHLMAYYSLKYKGKQTPHRFNLPRPFTNVVALMEHKISKSTLEKIVADKTLNFDYGVQF